MMKLFPLFHVLLPVFLFCQVVVQAQNQEKVDSLVAQISKSPDTTKIDIYIILNLEIIEKDVTQSLEYIHKAIALSEKLEDKPRIARSYMELAKFHDLKGDLAKAKVALLEVEKQLHHFHDLKIASAFHMERGIIHYFEGGYDNAVSDFWEALSGYEKLGDSVTVASCNMLIGLAHKELSSLDQALKYLLNSLRIYQNNNDDKGAAMAIGNIGEVYKLKKDFPSALTYYNRSLAFNRKYGYQEEARIDLNNIGSLYAELGEFGRAMEFHNQSLELAKSLQTKNGILDSRYNLAFVKYKLKNYQSAIAEFGEVLALAKELNFTVTIRDTHEVLSNIYEENENLVLALGHRKKYETWKDSLMSENYLKQVKELELEYETEKKDQQISLLAKEKEVQEKEVQRQATIKKASFGGIGLIALLAGLLVYTLYQRLKNQKIVASKNDEVKEANFKRQLTELEMKALQAQINPHFIFNCMNSINQMILESENQKASKYLTKFSKLIRLVLENADEPEVSLKDELSMLEAYIQLETLRFDGEIQYQIKIKEGIDQENTFLPSMVLQPFVENAICHGLMPKKEVGDGLITISIEQLQDQLVCLIEDNGVGREKALELQQKSVWKSKSLGLKITEERLQLLSKELQRQLIRITDLKDTLGQALGTRVEVSIPTA